LPDHSLLFTSFYSPVFVLLMTMGLALRRSRRATPRKTSEYSVGDVVEVVRGGVPFHGRLTALLTEGLAANPLWLIKYENHKEEELYEAAFGKLIKSANGGRLSMQKLTEDKDKAEESLSNRPRNQNPPKVKKAKSESSTKSSSSGDDSNKKTVSFSRGTSPVVSEDSEQINEEQKKKQSDREQRSLRRQAIIDVPSDVVGPLLTQSMPGPSDINKRRRPPSKSSNSQFNKRKLEDEKEAREVAKVKLVLLTGTLFLYRGVNGHRRAEFIRRV